MGLLLDRARYLVIKDIENIKVFNAFFISSVIGKTDL